MVGGAKVDIYIDFTFIINCVQKLPAPTFLKTEYKAENRFWIFCIQCLFIPWLKNGIGHNTFINACCSFKMGNIAAEARRMIDVAYGKYSVGKFWMTYEFEEREIYVVG